MRFRNYLFIFSFTFLITTHAKESFYSPFVKEVDFKIKDGLVFSNTPLNSNQIIQNHLRYMFGALNEINSGIDFPNLKINLKRVKISRDLYEITYSAKGTIAWDAKGIVPGNFNFILPKRGDEEGLTDFLNKYQKDCAKKASSLATFWNYYRPDRPNCNLLEEDVLELEAQLNEIEVTNTQSLPHYDKIFDDGIIEFTAILTKDNLNDPQDISIFDFKNLCEQFLKNSFSSDSTQQECHAETLIGGKLIKAHVFLVDNFNDKPDIFLKNIEPYLLRSDLVTFNGHSGMGVNIESLMNFYPIPKNKYQIIFLNSCDTYGYFKKQFFNRYPNKNLVDVILNATPNYFGTFENSNINLINSLLRSDNWTKILNSLPVEQHSLLTVF